MGAPAGQRQSLGSDEKRVRSSFLAHLQKVLPDRWCLRIATCIMPMCGASCSSCLVPQIFCMRLDASATAGGAVELCRELLNLFSLHVAALNSRAIATAFDVRLALPRDRRMSRIRVALSATI